MVAVTHLIGYRHRNEKYNEIGNKKMIFLNKRSCVNKSPWNRFGTGLEQVWNRFGTGLEQVWNRFGTGLEQVWKLLANC